MAGVRRGRQVFRGFRPAHSLLSHSYTSPSRTQSHYRILLFYISPFLFKPVKRPLLLVYLVYNYPQPGTSPSHSRKGASSEDLPEQRAYTYLYSVER